MKTIVSLSLLTLLMTMRPLVTEALTIHAQSGFQTDANLPYTSTDVTYTVNLTSSNVKYRDLPEDPILDLLGGAVEVGGKAYKIYLPAKGPYILKNTSPEKINILLFSTATRVCVDYDGDGKIGGDESWSADAPIRFGDKMLAIQSISADGKTLVMKESAGPVAGLIIGESAPDFELTDQGGTTHTLKSYAGKYLILDVWSTTCGPCQMNMPHVLELQKQYGADKLEVLLLSMDMSYGLPDTEKRNVETVKKLKMPWANVLVPNGWNMITKKFNTQGYGLWLINPEGKLVVSGPKHDMPAIYKALNFAPVEKKGE